MLKDSIIHFGESLPVDALMMAEEHAKLADLCIVLGSSLTVSPANGIPKTVLRRKEDGSKGKIVIVNLQKTDLDKQAALRIWGKTDEVIAAVKAELESSSCPAGPLGADAEDELASTVTHRVSAGQSRAATTASTAPPATSAPTPRQYRIGNHHQLLSGKSDGNAHRWTMYVQDLTGASVSGSSTHPRLTAVTYYLHPTFSPSEVTVPAPLCASREPYLFELSRVGWGTFPVGVKLSFSNGTSAFHYHDLSFADSGHSEVINVRA
jgi:hypothetical protein